MHVRLVQREQRAHCTPAASVASNFLAASRAQAERLASAALSARLSCRSVARRSTTGRVRGQRAGAHTVRSRAATSRRRRAAARLSPTAAPELCHSGTPRRGDARARGRSRHRRGVKIVRTVAELRDLVRQARAGAAPSATCRRGAPSHDGHLELMRSRTRAVGLRDRVALRQPDAVQRCRRT
jgi:hypothetical protein